MFRVLHRLLKLAGLGLLLGCGFVLWDRREQARPLADLFLVWQRAGYTTPDELPRVQGEITRMVSENTFEMKDVAGLKYRFTLVGMQPIIPRTAADKQARDALQASLAGQLVGQHAAVAYTMLDLLQHGAGFAYLGGSKISFNAELAEQGIARLNDQSVRLLPLEEQVFLRSVSRHRSGMLAAAPAGAQ